MEKESEMTFVQKTKKKIRGMLYEVKPGSLLNNNIQTKLSTYAK